MNGNGLYSWRLIWLTITRVGNASLFSQNINHMVGMGPPICICGDIHSLNCLKEQGFDVPGHPRLPLAHVALQRRGDRADLSFNTSFLQLTAWSWEVHAGEADRLQEQGHIHKMTVLLSSGTTIYLSGRMKDVSRDADICGLSESLSTHYSLTNKTISNK